MSDVFDTLDEEAPPKDIFDEVAAQPTRSSIPLPGGFGLNVGTPDIPQSGLERAGRDFAITPPELRKGVGPQATDLTLPGGTKLNFTGGVQFPTVRPPSLPGYPISEGAAKVGAGVYNTAAGLANFFLTPEGIATAMAPEVLPIRYAAPLLKGTFAGLGAKITGQLAGKASVTGDVQDITEAAGAGLLTGLATAAPTEGKTNAEGIREDTGQPKEAGKVAEGVKTDRGGDVQQTPPGQPEPVEQGKAQVQDAEKESSRVLLTPELQKQIDGAPPLQPGERYVQVVPKDGSEPYIASYADKSYDMGNLGKFHHIGKVSSEGKWSHGMARPGDRIVEIEGQKAPPALEMLKEPTLTPSILTPDGRLEGENHPEIRTEASKKGIDAMTGTPGVQDGFVLRRYKGDKGVFLSRPEAMAEFKKLRPDAKTSHPIALTSEDLVDQKMLGHLDEKTPETAPTSEPPKPPEKPIAEPEIQTTPGVTVKPNPQGKPEVHIASKPLPPGATLAASFFSAPASHPLGPLGSNSPRAAETLQHFTETVSKLPQAIRNTWRAFSMQSLPNITAANRTTGESGVRYAVSPQVGRAKGLEFAGKVTDGIKEPLFDQKLGTALSEDNLRSRKEELKQRVIESHRQAYDAEQAGDAESAKTLREQGQQAAADYNRVTSLVGAEHSPFPNEEAYQRFLASDSAQEAINRHKQLWEEQKDPLFRKANDLDPDVELDTRGLQTGARVNLKAILPDEVSKTGVGKTGRSPLIRQAATLLRRDPFAREMKGTGQVYEGSYNEIMANGFGKEYPVAAQHDFIKSLIDSGDAVLSQKEFPEKLQVKGEDTKAYLMKLKAWKGQWLQLRKSLAPEYESVSGLTPALKLPYYTKTSEFLTNQSVKGLAEGSTHVANLTTAVLTGLGPTANPMLNALIKSAGRADVLWTLPKVLIKGFTNQKSEMLKLAEIAAAKEPYGGSLGWFINKIDQGVRLTAADTYKGMAEKGWVPDTETGLREFVNQAGQYNKKLQPRTIQVLRDTGVQPFVTAQQTFNVQALRNLAMGPGAKGTSNAAALALRADKAAGLIGFAILVTAINKMVSGKTTGPPGTQLGSVGWIGDDKKLHQFNLSRLFGYARSGQVTGIGPAVEAQRLGLTPNQAVGAGVRSVAGTALNYATGPLNRGATIAVTGKRPGVPMVQEAPIVPPHDEMGPLKSQAAANVIQALQEANPAVDAVARYMEGKPLSEIAQRQFSRYTPRTGMTPETIKAMPKIVRTKEIQDYVDQLTKDARKLPIMERGKFVYDRIEKDGVETQDRADVLKRLRIKGVWRYE